MVATWLTAAFSAQSFFPSLARMPYTPALVAVMYCRSPPTSAAMIETYSAASVKSVDRQTVSPVFLFRQAIAPSAPPGVQSRWSPSIRTDSAYPHPPRRPLKSVAKFLAQTPFPVDRFRQARSPAPLRAYTRSPSTVGVPRGPPPQLPDCL